LATASTWAISAQGVVIVDRDDLVGAQTLRRLELALEDPCDHPDAPLLAGEDRRAADAARRAEDERRLPGLDPARDRNQFGPRCRHQRQSGGLDQVEAVRNLGQKLRLDGAQLRVGVIAPG
jgi:hypothetical protein